MLKIKNTHAFSYQYLQETEYLEIPDLGVGCGDLQTYSLCHSWNDFI